MLSGIARGVRRTMLPAVRYCSETRCTRKSHPTLQGLLIRLHRAGWAGFLDQQHLNRHYIAREGRIVHTDKTQPRASERWSSPQSLEGHQDLTVTITRISTCRENGGGRYDIKAKGRNDREEAESLEGKVARGVHRAWANAKRSCRPRNAMFINIAGPFLSRTSCALRFHIHSKSLA
nr:hypothetical protein CFP56_19649 [Quercus suber]